MTILHKDQRESFKGRMSESHNCIDCGVNTAPGIPPREVAEFLANSNSDGSFDITMTEDSEVYTVKDKVWKQAGMEPYGGCLCVGCLETRLGRKLKPKDFLRNHPFNNPSLPCTERLRDRRG